MQLRFARFWAAAFAIACGGTPERAPETGAAKAAAEPKPEAAESASAPSDVVKRPPRDGTPVIRLLTAGSEPHAPLRYAPRPSSREPLLMVMKMALGMGSPDVPGEPMALPTTSMNMDVTIDRVEPNGDIAYRFELTKIDVETGKHEPRITEQISAATSRLVGLKGSAKISSRGVVEQMKMNVPGSVDPAMKELMSEMERSMRQMCDPLPEEAIGKGARWDAHTRYTLRAIDIDQVRRYTLVERNEKRVRLKFIVEQTARPQSLRLPNMPPDARVFLEQLASAGDGVVALDTTHLVPENSKMGLRTTSVVKVNAEGKNLTMRTDMDIEVTLARPTGAAK